MKKLIQISILLGLCWTTKSIADIIYVSGDVSGTWSADTVMVTGEIRVPPGETLTIEPGVKVLFQVYCKFIVDSTATLLAIGTEANSILFDEYIPGTNWHGIRLVNASDSSKLEYCHLTHGQAVGSEFDAYGGSIYCNYSSPTIQNCLINTNYADDKGGGIACMYYSHPLISGNTISGNSAHADGGGIYCSNVSNPTISDNTISGNLANDGGGIYCFNNSSPHIIGNTIIGNDATTSGGGIVSNFGAHPFINENIISGNSAGNPVTDGSGGGVLILSSPNTFEFNEISGNLATYLGGGIFIQSTSATMNKNTIVYNEAPTGGGLYGWNSYPQLVNCILWENIPDQVYEDWNCDVQITYSDCQDGWPGTGNISEYPLFVDTTQGDYHLQEGSPCIDTGDPDPAYNDPDSTRADMGCYYYNQSAGVDQNEKLLPLRWALLSCHPNPFNPTTTISFELPVASLVKLGVYDISGRMIWAHSRAPLQMTPGLHEVSFDGSDLASGIYIYWLQAGEFKASGKMVLVK